MSSQRSMNETLIHCTYFDRLFPVIEPFTSLRSAFRRQAGPFTKHSYTSTCDHTLSGRIEFETIKLGHARNERATNGGL